MAIETEMKLRMPDESVIYGLMHDSEITQYLLDPFEERRMHTVFYDTAEFDLHRHNLMLRIRNDGHFNIVTVKGKFQNVNIRDPEGITVRQEWSCVCDEPMEGVRQIVAAGAPEDILAAIGDKALIAYAGAEFTRDAAVLHMDDGVRVEMALDCGTLRAGERSEPILELELELLFGNINTLPPFADKLKERYGMQTEELSKHGRAMQLLGKLRLQEL